MTIQHFWPSSLSGDRNSRAGYQVRPNSWPRQRYEGIHRPVPGSFVARVSSKPIFIKRIMIYQFGLRSVGH